MLLRYVLFGGKTVRRDIWRLRTEGWFQKGTCQVEANGQLQLLEVVELALTLLQATRTNAVGLDA